MDSDILHRSSENTKEKARLDVSCVGLWSPLEKTFLDVRVFHPNAPSNKTKTLSTLYKKNKIEKKKQYNSRVINVEKKPLYQ